MFSFDSIKSLFGVKSETEKRNEKMGEIISDLIGSERALDLLDKVAESVKQIAEAKQREDQMIQKALTFMTEHPGSPGVLVVRGMACPPGKECTEEKTYPVEDHIPTSEVTLDKRVPFGKVGYLMTDDGVIIDRDTHEVLYQ